MSRTGQEALMSAVVPLSDLLTQARAEFGSYADKDCLYNDTRDRRFHFEWPSDSTILAVCLQAKTYEATWATLMRVGVNHPEQGDDFYYYLSMEVLTGKPWGKAAVESSIVSYSTERPIWKLAIASGLRGELHRMEEQLRQMSPNGVYLRELPRYIDVAASAQLFLDHLRRHDFTQPPFILKQSTVQVIVDQVKALFPHAS